MGEDTSHGYAVLASNRLRSLQVWVHCSMKACSPEAAKSSSWSPCSFLCTAAGEAAVCGGCGEFERVGNTAQYRHEVKEINNIRLNV